MESSANNNTLNKITIARMNLNDPDQNTIAVVLEEELKRNYTEVTVEWVTSHPKLSDPPFNLAAPGICGNTALLDFGDESYFHKPFTDLNILDFKDFLRNSDRDGSNSFIFGHGVFPHLSSCSLREIVLNALFPPATNGRIDGRSNSGLTIIDTTRKKCGKEMLHLSQLKCIIQGTYFLSEGLEADEMKPVLRVYAKGPHLDNVPFCGSDRFIKPMQEALQKRYGPETFVALGGVYTVNNVTWRHKCVRNWWEPSTIVNCNCLVDATETMITTFSNSREYHQINPELLIRLNSCQSYHSLSHHSCSENYIYLYETNKLEEYEGYFCPAETLYRTDEPPQ